MLCRIAINVCVEGVSAAGEHGRGCTERNKAPSVAPGGAEASERVCGEGRRVARKRQGKLGARVGMDGAGDRCWALTWGLLQPWLLAPNTTAGCRALPGPPHPQDRPPPGGNATPFPTQKKKKEELSQSTLKPALF